MKALIIVGAVLVYFGGVLLAAYLCARAWGKDPNDDPEAALGPIFWPFMVVFACPFLFARAVYRMGVYHHENPKPKKAHPKAPAPPPCRCNGGAQPCPLPPQEGVFR